MLKELRERWWLDGGKCSFGLVSVGKLFCKRKCQCKANIDRYILEKVLE
jgi:hypothetical protein